MTRSTIGLNCLVEVREHDAPYRLHDIQIERCGRVHTGQKRWQLFIEPLRKSVDDRCARKLARRQAAHPVAHHSHKDFPKACLCHLYTTCVLINAATGALIRTCCYNRHGEDHLPTETPPVKRPFLYK